MVSPSSFILASSICKSLQCLISTLTQEGEGGYLLRLTCSVVLWGGRDTAKKYYWHVWGVLTVDGPHWICHSPRWHVFPRSILLRLQGTLQGHCPKWALCFMQLPSLSHSGSQVLLKDTDPDVLFVCPSQVQAVQQLCPRPKQLGPRTQGSTHCPGGPCVLSTSSVLATSFPGVLWEHSPRSVVCLLLGTDVRLWPSWQMSTVQGPRKAWLATGSLLTVWRKVQSLGPRLHQPFRLWLSHACHSASREGEPYMAAGLLSFGTHSALSFVSMPGITVWCRSLSWERSLCVSLWWSHGLCCYLTLAPPGCPQGIQAQFLP